MSIRYNDQQLEKLSDLLHEMFVFILMANTAKPLMATLAIRHSLKNQCSNYVLTNFRLSFKAGPY